MSDYEMGWRAGFRHAIAGLAKEGVPYKVIRVHDELTFEELQPDARIEAAIKLAVEWGGIDGDHHKAYVIDQMVRALAGDRYAEIVREAKAGEDGPETYEWNEGVAP